MQKTFEINSFFGGSYTCCLELSEYADNGHIAVQVWDVEDGPYATLTVNLPETKRHPQNFAFLDVNNFPSGPDLVERLGIGKSTGKYGWSGYCAYPLYELFPEKIREFCWDENAEDAEDAEDQEITVYKMFRQKNGKLFPLFVDANRELPIGELLFATVGQRGKDETHVKSRIGDLSLRPGFHSTMVPFSDWIGKKAEDGTLLQRRDTVWCECTVPGHEITVTARNGLREIPDGWYRFRTNSRQRDPWIISSQIRINKILPYEEVCAICREHGLEPQKMED